jgi:hypothetical protein
MNAIKLSLDQIAKKFGNEKYISTDFKSLIKNKIDDYTIQVLEDNDQYNLYRCILSQISDKYQFAFTNDSKLIILKEFIDKLIKYLYTNNLNISKGNKYINNIITCDFIITIDILKDICKCIDINIIIIKDETINTFNTKYNNILNFNIETINCISYISDINNKYILCLETNNIYSPIIFKDNNKMKDFIDYISN